MGKPGSIKMCQKDGELGPSPHLARALYKVMHSSTRTRHTSVQIFDTQQELTLRFDTRMVTVECNNVMMCTVFNATQKKGHLQEYMCTRDQLWSKHQYEMTYDCTLPLLNRLQWVTS
ncbi:hypothetical protein BaRGS_00005408 [Batillaria attramentaria]|uniref:Uncharacterized protein n=1 Tax=Batillaria attramentaria TaxID=370345 RepID=A0ABD0LWZ1_9CAEN